MEIYRTACRSFNTFLSALIVLGVCALVGCGNDDSAQSDSPAQAKAAAAEAASVSAELEARSEQQQKAVQQQSQRDALNDTLAFIDLGSGQFVLHLSSPESVSIISSVEMPETRIHEAALNDPLPQYEDASIDIIVFDSSIKNLLLQLETDRQWLVELERVLGASGQLIVIDSPPEEKEKEEEKTAQVLVDANDVTKLAVLLAGHGMQQQGMINLPVTDKKLASTTLIKFIKISEKI